MQKGYQGLQQLLERGGIKFTGQYHIDMDNAKHVMKGMACGDSTALPGSPKHKWHEVISQEVYLDCLGWLAIHEPEWKDDKFLYIRRDPLWGVMYHNVLNDMFKWHTRKQWLNMRYHLGLDKKPHYRLTGGGWVKV